MEDILIWLIVGGIAGWLAWNSLDNTRLRPGF